MKFKISPFLRVFYLAVKAFVLVTFGIFYRKEKSHNEHYFSAPAPCIIIGNHPNTLMDVMNVAKKKKAIVHFLTNAGLFSTPFGNWFFSTFYAIKVERPKDVQGRRINNADSFKKSAEFLSRNGTLYIAAEGSSKLERRLRKIKTGAARIALDTMQKSDWTLPLKILPVGITYENPKLARYDLFYNFGEPISLIDYKANYEKEPAKTVKRLTADIQTSMQGLLLHTEPEDDDVDKIVQKLERIHKNEFGNDHAEQFFVSKKWIASLLDMKYNDSAKYESLQTKVNNYCEAITQNLLIDQAVLEKGKPMETWLSFITFIIPAIWGWINNALAFLLPDFIIKKAGLYPGYTSTLKLLLIILLFPLTYWLQYRLLSALGIFPTSYIVYLISTIIFGFIAIAYGRTWKQYRANQRWRQLRKQNTSLYNSIKQQRSEIINTVFSQLTP